MSGQKSFIHSFNNFVFMLLATVTLEFSSKNLNTHRKVSFLLQTTSNSINSVAYNNEAKCNIHEEILKPEIYYLLRLLKFVGNKQNKIKMLNVFLHNILSVKEQQILI